MEKSQPCQGKKTISTSAWFDTFECNTPTSRLLADSASVGAAQLQANWVEETHKAGLPYLQGEANSISCGVTRY